MKARRRLATAALAFALFGWGFTAAAWAQMATADRVRAPGWWPTKGTAPRGDYVGADACSNCHAGHAATQGETPMARTLKRAQDSEVLRHNEELRFRLGPIAYEIRRRGEQSMYSVADAKGSLTAPLVWAFGFGKIGQTYFFEKDGGLREARVSYFDTLRRLDFTPTRGLSSPRDLEEAMARPVDDAEARRCFGCHTTAATTAGSFEPAHMTPGVRCEACHGPGRKHAETLDRAATLNPARLDPADSVDFCGACHATFWDVKLAGEKGIAALRSQPHRLQSSRCWSDGDARLTCTACHDPHRTLEREPVRYDARCLSCHLREGEPASLRSKRPCPVAKARCVTCHMPKYDVPEMHFRFTDHLIRVVRGKP